MAVFSHLDWGIIGIYLMLVLANGLRASRQVHGLKDFSIASKSYPAWIVFATLSAAYIGGGFTLGLAEKVYSLGFLYVIALWGFSLKEILIARYIAPRMAAFENVSSVGEIMGQLYGQRARILTGLAGALVCAGIAGGQFAAFGYVMKLFTGIPLSLSIPLGAGLVILYSSLGGMRAVVANDTLHFIVLMVALPLVFLLSLETLGGFQNLMASLPADRLTLSADISWLTLGALFLSFFFGETLVPPYVQRLLIGKSFRETARGTLWSGLMSIPFFAMIAGLGLMALALAPDLNPSMALPHVIEISMPSGLKGLAIAGIIAVVMSSADAFLNAAAVCISHDVVKPLRQKTLGATQELFLGRMATLAIGLVGMLFALSHTSILDILLLAYNFWTPFILVPLVAGILGYRTTADVFWKSAFTGISVMGMALLWQGQQTRFDAAIFGIFANFITFWMLYRPLPVVSVTDTLPESPSVSWPSTGTDG